MSDAKVLHSPKWLLMSGGFKTTLQKHQEEETAAFQTFPRIQHESQKLRYSGINRVKKGNAATQLLEKQRSFCNYSRKYPQKHHIQVINHVISLKNNFKNFS